MRAIIRIEQRHHVRHFGFSVKRSVADVQCVCRRGGSMMYARSALSNVIMCVRLAQVQ